MNVQTTFMISPVFSTKCLTNKIRNANKKASENPVLYGNPKLYFYKFTTPLVTDFTCIMPVATSKKTVRP